MLLAIGTVLYTKFHVKKMQSFLFALYFVVYKI